mgnify:CR=1 FL=1
MTKATSCGGVVIFRGKILLLYKNYRNKYEGGWLPKGLLGRRRSLRKRHSREVKEETGCRRIYCEICRQEPVQLQYIPGCGDEGSPLVFDDV